MGIVKRPKKKPARAARPTRASKPARAAKPAPAARWCLLRGLIILRGDSDTLLIKSPDDERWIFEIRGEIACAAFRLLSARRSVDSVARALVKRYSQAPLPRVTADVRRLSESLVRNRILLPISGAQ
jgi:hypothetical protein